MELADDSSGWSLPLRAVWLLTKGGRGWGGGGNHRPPRGRIKGFKTMPLTKGAGVEGGGGAVGGGGGVVGGGKVQSIIRFRNHVATDQYLKSLNKWQWTST